MNCTPFVRQVCYNTCTKKWGAVQIRQKCFLTAFLYVFFNGQPHVLHINTLFSAVHFGILDQ